MRTMKKYLFLILPFALTLMLTQTSCAKKTGCAINDNAHVQMGKDGDLPTKRGKSNLFSKKARKKMSR